MLIKRASMPGFIMAVLSCLVGCQPSAPGVSGPEASVVSAKALDRVAASAPVRKSLQLFSRQPGRIAPFEESPMFPKLAGYVEEVAVDIGDRVKRGQLLVRLSIPELKDQLDQKLGLVEQARAEVSQAEAAIEASIASVKSAEALVTQAEASVGRAEGEYERWNSERGRITKLVESGSVTSKLADEALSQFRAAEATKLEVAAAVESAIAMRREAEANVAKAQADLVATQAKVRVAESNVAAARTMLSYTEIIAPFDGLVTHRNVDTGHYVHPANANNSEPLVTVASTDRVRVFVDVPESEASSVDAGFGDEKLGDTVTVTLQSSGHPSFDGRVTRTSWSLHPENRSLRVEIDLPNEKQAMLPGSYATVILLLDERKDVLTLPITAIVRDKAEASCCVVEDGVIKKRQIQLGLRVGEDVEISRGLEGDETVVLKGAASLVDGQRVELVAAVPKS